MGRKSISSCFPGVDLIEESEKEDVKNVLSTLRWVKELFLALLHTCFGLCEVVDNRRASRQLGKGSIAVHAGKPATFIFDDVLVVN